jgi:hypothetical protein
VQFNLPFQILVKRFFFGSKYCGDMGQDLYEQSINGEDVDFADLAEDVMGNK